jgi:hypothetical protein
MVKSELRTGNLIKIGNRITPVFTIVYSRGEGWPINNVPIGNIEPIELTPEILEAAGFIGHYSIYQKDIGVTSSSICARQDGNLMEVWIEKYIGEDERIVEINTPVKYLHQLQNLFFALCGEELEIQLNSIIK